MGGYMLRWRERGLEFHPSRERGRWARRLPHLPACFEGGSGEQNRGFIAEVMLRWGHRGLHSRSIPIHIVLGGREAYLLLAVSGFSVTQVA